MAINSATLMSLKGNLVVGVKTTSVFQMVDLVRIKKAIAEGIYDQSYDMNNDGILDNTDYEILSNIVLGNIFGWTISK